MSTFGVYAGSFDPLSGRIGLAETTRLRLDLAKAVRLLRMAEWSGSAGRCPWCNEWPTVGQTDGLGNETHDGHAEDCQHVAFLAHVSRCA